MISVAKILGREFINMTYLKERGDVFCRIIFLAIILGVLVVLANPHIGHADATRIAKVTDVSGDVQIFKGGGSKSYDAYEGMDVTEGDYITTGKDSSIVLDIAERQDELTIGEHAKLYVTQLREHHGTKKTTIKMWSGAMGVKASTLDTDDTFEIETPTELMTVRGTHFLTTVDPVTGDTVLFVLSGVVSSNRNGDQDTVPDQVVAIYPSQMGYFHDEFDRDNMTGLVDPNSLMDLVGADVIEAILRNKRAIDEENEALLDQLRQDGIPNAPPLLDLDRNEDLERLNRNLENLVDTIARNAVEREVITQDEIEKIVRETDGSVDINLNAPPALDLNEAQKRRQEQMMEQQEKRRQQAEEQRQQQREKQQQQAELLEKIKEEKERQQQENQRKLEEQRRKAEERYLDGLSASQKEAFQERKDQLNREREQTPSPRPPSTGGSGGSGNSPSPSLLTPPSLLVDDVVFGEEVEIWFEDPEDHWLERIVKIQVDEEDEDVKSHVAELVSPIAIPSGLFGGPGTYMITIKATGYRDATVEVTISESEHSISGYIRLPEGVENEEDLVVTVSALDKDSYEAVSFDTITFQNERLKPFSLYFAKDLSDEQFILKYELSEKNSTFFSSAYYLNDEQYSRGMTVFEPSEETPLDYYLVPVDSSEKNITILQALEIIDINSVYSDSFVFEYQPIDNTSWYDYKLLNDDTGEWINFNNVDYLMFDGRIQVNRLSDSAMEDLTPTLLTPNTNYTLFVIKQRDDCEKCGESAVGQYNFSTPNNLSDYESSPKIISSSLDGNEVYIDFDQLVTLTTEPDIRIFKYTDDELPVEIDFETISISPDGEQSRLNIKLKSLGENSDTLYTIFLGEGTVTEEGTPSNVNSAISISIWTPISIPD